MNTMPFYLSARKIRKNTNKTYDIHKHTKIYITSKCIILHILCKHRKYYIVHLKKLLQFKSNNLQISLKLICP